MNILFLAKIAQDSPEKNELEIQALFLYPRSTSSSKIFQRRQRDSSLSALTHTRKILTHTKFSNIYVSFFFSAKDKHGKDILAASLSWRAQYLFARLYTCVIYVSRASLQRFSKHEFYRCL